MGVETKFVRTTELKNTILAKLKFKMQQMRGGCLTTDILASY